MPSGQDAYVLFKVLERCQRLYILDRPLYFYRTRSNATHTIARKKILSQILLSLFIIEFVENHIPEFFADEDLRKSRRLYFENIVICYAYYPDNEGRACREDLRNKIIETGNKIGLENCGKRAKIAWWIFLKCPSLLKPMYAFVWPFVKKLKNFLHRE